MSLIIDLNSEQTDNDDDKILSKILIWSLITYVFSYYYTYNIIIISAY